MYAVVGRANLDHDRLGEIVATITSLVVPIMRARPGHVATYVCRSTDGTSGVALSVFETRDQADATASALMVPARRSRPRREYRGTRSSRQRLVSRAVDLALPL